mmetsp:Transcript_32093/g.65080  ORF Transcript_32093/g.65080 Transcript_32093/m.65080 type:complete len:80 (+) Transcript_32093:2-241(+)
MFAFPRLSGSAQAVESSIATLPSCASFHELKHDLESFWATPEIKEYHANFVPAPALFANKKALGLWARRAEITLCVTSL